MVVIGCVTKSVLPEKVEFEEMQDYTLSLESELICRFKFEKVDKRIENSTHNSGKKSSGFRKGYCIYIAMKLEEATDSSDGSDDDS